MGDMKIRQYDPSDLEVCRSLWQELTRYHGEIYDDPSMGGDESRALFDEHLARVGAERVWVGELEGRVIGMVSLIVDDKEAEVEPVVMTSTHRGEGCGRALLGYAIERARELEVQYLSVKPVARNERAMAFFHKAGFRTLGHVQMFMELGPQETGQWRQGPDLFGSPFRY
jgi:GNAT superfamily N-acetyltransferase